MSPSKKRDGCAAARKACARLARANPGQLVALGWLSVLELKNGKRVRVPRSTLLAYDPSAKTRGLVIVYDVKTSRAQPPESAVKEYKKTHWGEGGAWGISNGDAPEATREQRWKGYELARVIYTTKKGGDNALTDYDHAFEKQLPRLIKCDRGRVQIYGGTYRVTERGIVG